MSREGLQKVDGAGGAIALFEKALGGRAHVLESLAIDSTAEIQRFVRLLLDPAYDDLSLAELAEQAQVGLTDLLRAYRNATLIKAHILATNEIARRLPELAADVMVRALPQSTLCPVCRGEGSRAKSGPEATPVPCKACDGTGKVVRPPPVARQRLALEIAELIRPPKDRPALLQQININPNTPSPGSTSPGSLEQLQQAVTAILYNKRGTVIEVQPVQEPDPGAERG